MTDRDPKELFEKVLSGSNLKRLADRIHFRDKVLLLHKKQLLFSFRILTLCLAFLMVSIVGPVVWPNDQLISRMALLEELDHLTFVKTVFTTIIGAAIALALGSFYNPNASTSKDIED